MYRPAVIRWGAAALVAVVTSIVVASDLAVLHRRARSLGPERTVLVADGDLELGTTLTDADLTTRKIHESQLPPEVSTTIENVRGRVVVVPLLDGAYVTSRHVAPADRDGLDGVVPVGSRAVQIHPMAAPALRPGDVVDVLAAFDTTEAVDARIAARSALVLRVDEHDDVETGSPPVTLLVATDEAARVAEAAAVGAIHLALAAPEEATADD